MPRPHSEEQIVTYILQYPVPATFAAEAVAAWVSEMGTDTGASVNKDASFRSCRRQLTTDHNICRVNVQLKQPCRT